MCGAVILTGGLFLFVMNVYNYHRLDKKGKAKDQELQGGDSQQQEKALELMPEEGPQAPGSGEDETGPGAVEEDVAMGEDGAMGDHVRRSADHLSKGSQEFHDISI